MKTSFGAGFAALFRHIERMSQYCHSYLKIPGCTVVRAPDRIPAAALGGRRACPRAILGAKHGSMAKFSLVQLGVLYVSGRSCIHVFCSRTHLRAGQSAQRQPADGVGRCFVQPWQPRLQHKRHCRGVPASTKFTPEHAQGLSPPLGELGVSGSLHVF